MGKKQSAANVAERDRQPALTPQRLDLRAQRTKIFIQNALGELAKRRSFDGISVRDISQHAMINRTTFYRYYRDKYHLVEEIFKGAMQKLADELGPPLVVREMSDLSHALADERVLAAWVGLMEHFASNSRLYTPVLVGKGGAWFQARMREDLMKFFRGRIHSKVHEKDTTQIPPEVARCFYASAIIGVVFYWLTGGMKHSAFQMARWFRVIAYKGYIATIAGLKG